MNMKQTCQLLLVAVASVAVAGGSLVFGHEDDEEPPPAPAILGKPRTAPSISDLNAFRPDGGEQQVVRASRFELTDRAGKTRAVLGLSAEDEPSFALADRSGQIYARLSLDSVPGDPEGVPVMQLLDKKGTVRTDIRLTRDGDPQIVLKNQKGGHLASLSGTAIHRGGTEWLLSDDRGNVRALLTVNHAGTNLTFMDEAKKVRSRLSVAPDGTPKLIFADEVGRQKTVAGYDVSQTGTAASDISSRQR